jgi:hypothetical protein
MIYAIPNKGVDGIDYSADARTRIRILDERTWARASLFPFYYHFLFSSYCI